MSNAKTPILNLILKGDADAQGHKILNLDLSGLASGAPFFDNTALIRGNVDGTKLAHFDLSLIGSAQHRVFQLPNYNGRIATVAGVEDLTNKSINGITLTGDGGIDLDGGIVAITGEFFTEDDVSILGGSLIARLDGGTDLTFPKTGTVATTGQIPVISDVAYNATTWNGNLDGATKNAIRDKFESLAAIVTPPFADNKEIVANLADATKLLKFDLSGVSTSTTRTLTVPNKSGTIALLDDVPYVAGILFGADEAGRSLSLAGDVAFYGPFTFEGGFDTIMHVSGVTDLTLPENGTLATWDGEETFTNKVINGGQVNSLEKFSLRSGGAAHDLVIQTSSAFTSDRELNIEIGDANRTLTLRNNFTTSTHALTLSTVGTTALTLPTDGTVMATVAAPASAGSDGTAGQFAYDATHFYACVATDTWVRCTLATWP